MTINDVLQKAIAAAQEMDEAGSALSPGWRRVPNEQVARLLIGAAAPIRDAAAAAERDRIRQLAEQHHAVCRGKSGDPHLLRPFTDLLGGGS